MLQFIAEQNSKYSIAEQINLAIQGGCTWIQLHLPNNSDDEVRDILTEIIPICRKSGTILMLEDHPEIAREKGVHGVHLTNTSANARQLRQDFGAEAIIGINVVSAQGIPTLAKLDIDYVAIAPELSMSDAKEIVDTVRSLNCNIPIVLTGDFNCLDIANIRATGASGVATGKKLIADNDPTNAVAQLITALMQ